jgi:TRAP transporter TAXI family solute receptor
MAIARWRLAVVCAVLLAPGAALAGFDDRNPITYIVDGATATGYFKVVSEAINGVVRDAYPGSTGTYQPGSPAGGIQQIATGKADFIFTGGAPEIAYALEGKAPFQQSLKGKFDFVMLLHDELVVHNFMTKDWADRNGIKSFADIAAKKPKIRLAVNTAANLQSTLGMYLAIFGAYGIDEAAVTDGGKLLFRGNSDTGLEAIRDGKIDVLINGGFVPTSTVADIARSRDLVWLSGDAAHMKQAAERWGYSPYTVKAGAYSFVTKDEYTITLWSAVLAGAQVPEETVYKFVKALATNPEKVRGIHPSLGAFDIKTSARNPTQVAYHPGALRYYKEIGAAK